MPRSAIRFLRVPFLSIVVTTMAALTVPAVAAQASPSSAYWVTPAGARDCPSGYATIQAAVSAAESYESAHRHGAVPVVDICPGTYAEQVTITQSLVLTRGPVRPGLGPVTIELPASVGANQASGLSTTTCQLKDGTVNPAVQVPQSVIEVCAADASGGNTTGTTVTASDLTVEGNWPGSVCYDSLYGVLVGGGAALNLTDSTVEQVGAVSPLSGCQGGVGVEIGSAPTSQVGHAVLRDDSIKTYQKNGITIDGPGSTAQIDGVTVTGAGPTAAVAQNGIQVSFGATASIANSSVSGNNYTGTGGASSAGILVFGGGGSKCGLGATSPLVRHSAFTGNRLSENDMGIGFFNLDSACAKSVQTVTGDLACGNVIENSHGYPGGKPSADANVSGWPETLLTPTPPTTGYQAGVDDYGDRDVICDNAVSGAGYAPLGSTSSLPRVAPPAFVRPVDIVSGPAISPQVYGNTFDGRPYRPA